LALAWTLRDSRMTSTMLGGSSIALLEDSLGALANTSFSDDELVEIDRYGTESDINLWARSSAG
jgi:L-glyceraldehyde 3-phosphate reductase